MPSHTVYAVSSPTVVKQVLSAVLTQCLECASAVLTNNGTPKPFRSV